MTMVSIEKEILEDLINHKLRYVKEDIENILKKWHYHIAEPFLEDARNGVLKNAEDDAIVLRNLLDELDHLNSIHMKYQYN